MCKEVPHGFRLRAGETKRKLLRNLPGKHWDIDDGAGNYGICPAKHGLIGDAWNAELRASVFLKDGTSDRRILKLA